MQHRRAYRGRDDSASPDERALKNRLFRPTGALEDTEAPDDDDLSCYGTWPLAHAAMIIMNDQQIEPHQ